MDKLVLILQLVVIIQTSTAQINQDGQCLSICSNSWPDTRGPAGPPGQPGAPGTGVKGQTGRPGKVGPQGVKEDKGINGGVGLAGVKGQKGETPNQVKVAFSVARQSGQPGVIGPAGTQGVKGDPGYKGEIAFIGQPGTGVKGQTGRPGKVGPQGVKGDKGINGGVGLAGVKGQKGETPNQVKVAFSVARQSGMSGTSSEQNITYTHSIVQENANIDINTGVFTCQVPGIYYFSFTFYSYSGKKLWILLKLNDEYKFRIYQPSQSGYRMQSQSGMLHLGQGDQVKLVLGAGTHYRFYYTTTANSHYTNTFNGYLIS
ncbi:uncharacterized protein LOC144434818 [Glandiceps talaboti]